MVTIDSIKEIHGLTRPEAFTLLRDQLNAERGVTSIAYPSPEYPPEQNTPPPDNVVAAEFYVHVRDRLKAALGPYFSQEDIDRLVAEAEAGK